MNEINRLPDDEPALNELHDPLRGIVEHILSQPTPQESMERALERARVIHAAPPRRWFHLHPEIQVRIAIAAAILIAVAVGFSANVFEHGVPERGLSRIRSSSDRFALADEPPITFPRPQTWSAITGERKKTTFDSVQDGTSNSMMISEQFRPFGGLKDQAAFSTTPQQGNGQVDPGKSPADDWNALGAFQKPLVSPPTGFIHIAGDGSTHNSEYGIDPEVLKALGGREDGLTSLGGGGSGGGFGFRPGPLQRPQSGPLNNGSLQPGFIFGYPQTPPPMFAGGNSFGGNGQIPPNVFDLPSIGSYLGNGGGFGPPVLSKMPYVNRIGGRSSGGGGFGGEIGTGVNLREELQQTLREQHISRSATSTEEVRKEKLRIDKTVDLAEKWKELPEAERNKALTDLTQDASPHYKQIVTSYFGNLNQTKAQKQPQVWHRDGQRPTFARVYLGGGNSLDLVSLQVSITIEGPRARTVVDHIFHNPHDRQLEGTFEYPLPTGASVSYFGMFQGQTRPNAEGGRRNAESKETSKLRIPHSELRIPAAPARLNPSEMAHQVTTADWGTLQEARVVSKQKALETYEDIVRTRIDPALLEYAGGNTFTGRVFPIQPKGYNRVIIAYEELLPMVNEHALYRFPLPNRKLSEMQVTLQANEADFSEAVFFPKEARKETGGGRMVYSHTWKDTTPSPLSPLPPGEKGKREVAPTGELVFAGLPARTQLQAVTGRQGDSGPTYLYARIRPQLKVETGRPFSDHAVFLLDTSLSEHPDRFAVSMKLWQQILASDPGIKKFNILAFNVGTSWVEPKGWLDNMPEGRGKALARLDGIVLEGATDLSAALTQLTRGSAATPLAGLAKHAPLEVFLLSDGQVTWGNRDSNSLVAHFEANCPYAARFHCYTIGLGAENIELFQALTRRGGGIYPCYTEAYLPAVARAHRNHCLLVERVSFKGASTRGGPEMGDVLVAGRQMAVYPGGELVVAAKSEVRSQESGVRSKDEKQSSAHRLPRTKLVVEGTFLGERVVYEYPIDIYASSELAARGWGELAVSSLLALNDPKLDSLVTAYCQQFGIGSRVASFLVLENPADYKRLNLEEERGKVVPGGDLEQFLDDAWRNLARVIKPKQAFEEFLNGRAEVRQHPGPHGPRLATAEDHVRKLFALLTDKDFELPEDGSGDALIRKKEVSPAYLAARQADPMNVHVYLDEAKRRANGKDAHGAIRVLSSVVEAFPTRADALRLVGYRLLDMQQPAQAVRLFQQVEWSRPFEPHSYRDLARSLEESGRYGFAALQYEIMLAGMWHNRFRDSLKEVAREEYVHMMQEALAKFRNPPHPTRSPQGRGDEGARISKELADYFGERLEGMTGIRQEADLRVTISWNTDNTDVDLWVMEPDGTKCFYQNRTTSSGGQLSQDQTQGYGPERYQVQKALPGVYTVIVHYYRADANLLGGETHVNVLVTKHAGTPEELVERHTVLLRQANEQVEVCRIKVSGE